MWWILLILYFHIYLLIQNSDKRESPLNFCDSPRWHRTIFNNIPIIYPWFTCANRMNGMLPYLNNWSSNSFNWTCVIYRWTTFLIFNKHTSTYLYIVNQMGKHPIWKADTSRDKCQSPGSPFRGHTFEKTLFI